MYIREDQRAKAPREREREEGGLQNNTTTRQERGHKSTPPPPQRLRLARIYKNKEVRSHLLWMCTWKTPGDLWTRAATPGILYTPLYNATPRARARNITKFSRLSRERELFFLFRELRAALMVVCAQLIIPPWLLTLAADPNCVRGEGRASRLLYKRGILLLLLFSYICVNNINVYLRWLSYLRRNMCVVVYTSRAHIVARRRGYTQRFLAFRGTHRSRIYTSWI